MALCVKEGVGLQSHLQLLGGDMPWFSSHSPDAPLDVFCWLVLLSQELVKIPSWALFLLHSVPPLLVISSLPGASVLVTEASNKHMSCSGVSSRATDLVNGLFDFFWMS